ncbi:prohibitin family protein [Cytobacillus horneckiae]|uniref:prohibitin family protein n=1 Tax=Cytobacillus horneckiae TaxID=549687 RepID=UPI0034CEF441
MIKKLKGKNPFKVGAILLGILILLAGIITPMFVVKISTGHVGLVYSPSGGVKEETLNEGWHLVGLFEKVIEYPTRLQTVTYKDMILSTKDGKNISADLSYTYKVDPTKVVSIFKEFGNIKVEDIEQGYLEKRMLASARKAVSQYDILGVYGEDSSRAALEIQQIFSEDVADIGFMISDTTLGAPKPDEKTQAAIDSRIQASQETEKKKIELENEKIEAEKKKVVADGEAQKKLIEAKADAEANRIVSESITPEVLKQMEMKARIKHGWITVNGAAAVVESK